MKMKLKIKTKVMEELGQMYANVQKGNDYFWQKFWIRNTKTHTQIVQAVKTYVGMYYFEFFIYKLKKNKS